MSQEDRFMEYTAVIERDGEGYSVHFPDVPGCFTQGDTLEEARANASEALKEYLDVLRELGKPLPEPSTAVESIRVKAS